MHFFTMLILCLVISPGSTSDQEPPAEQAAAVRPVHLGGSVKAHTEAQEIQESSIIMPKKL